MLAKNDFAKIFAENLTCRGAEFVAMKKFLSTTAAAFFMMTSAVSAAPMSLNVHDADLRATIIMVTRAGGLNVSVDDAIKGNISVSLANVEPIKILEVIAKTKNLNLVHDGDIFIMTTTFNNFEPMQSYVLPIHYADAEVLRKAVVMSLNRDNTVENSATATSDNNKKSSGSSVSMWWRYESRNKVEEDKEKRDERVFYSPDVNALVLYGTETEYQRAKKILEVLDVELKQVSLEAKLLAIDKNASKNLGVEWFWSAFPQYPDREIESYQSSSGAYRERITYDRNFNDNTGYGILRFGKGPEGYPFEWYYGAKINALVTNGKAKILSRPNVTTIQGHEAVINVGSSVPIPKVSTNNTATTTEIEYRDAGIILKYTPRVNADGTITATIHTEVSTPQYVEELKAYRFNKRSADTVVTVRDGEPMIIGGLIGAEEEKSISKIPILGDLPILGALFRSHKKNKSESELMIFLTAHVLKGAGVGAPANVRYTVDENTLLE